MKIGTHNGVFHADDVFAVAALMLSALFRGVEIIRTRDEKIISSCDVVVDVGGEYDHGRGRFDHHQRGGAGVRENVPYAAFGLVWKHYGVDIAGSQDVADIVERNLVMSVDAADTGYALVDPKGDIIPYSVSAVVSSLNPSWQEEVQDFDGQFKVAVEMASLILQREIVRAQGVVDARDAVRDAIAASTDPRLVVLERFCPWVETLVPESAETLFVAFPAPTGDWRIQAVPPTIDSFEKRKELPKEWAGLRGDELVALTGVSDAVFCHPGRFIAGAQSREGVLALAKLALEV